MYTLLHLVCNDQSLSEYASADDLESCYRPACDGVEMIRAGVDSRRIIRPETVIGVHLPFYSYWLDFWNGDTARLTAEFGSLKTCRGFYGGEGRETLLRRFQSELDDAQALGARYVVFHVSDVTLQETFTNRYHHTDEEVIDAAAELVNQLLRGRGYSFDFLLENLWYPGLRLTSPVLTRRLLDRVEYPRRGILLDTGHLLNTNPSLRTGEEALAYLHHILDIHGGLCRFIKGVHLHQSLSGDYVERAHQNIPPMEPDYYDRFAQSYAHVGRVDTHQPMLFNGTRELIERISPRYLVYEFLAPDRRRQEILLRRQAGVFRR